MPVYSLILQKRENDFGLYRMTENYLSNTVSWGIGMSLLGLNIGTNAYSNNTRCHTIHHSWSQRGKVERMTWLWNAMHLLLQCPVTELMPNNSTNKLTLSLKHLPIYLKLFNCECLLGDLSHSFPLKSVMTKNTTWIWIVSSLLTVWFSTSICRKV